MTKNKNLMRRLAWYRRKEVDEYNPKYYTVIECIVPLPTMQSPYPCILVAFRNASTNILIRAATIERLKRLTWCPDDVIQRLSLALGEAQKVANQIEEDMRLIMQRRQLANISEPAWQGKVDTVAQAERILQGGANGKP